jgi:hypothetical protein
MEMRNAFKDSSSDLAFPSGKSSYKSSSAIPLHKLLPSVGIKASSGSQFPSGSPAANAEASPSNTPGHRCFKVKRSFNALLRSSTYDAIWWLGIKAFAPIQQRRFERKGNLSRKGLAIPQKRTKWKHLFPRKDRLIQLFISIWTKAIQMAIQIQFCLTGIHRVHRSCNFKEVTCDTRTALQGKFRRNLLRW